MLLYEISIKISEERDQEMEIFIKGVNPSFHQKEQSTWEIYKHTLIKWRGKVWLNHSRANIECWVDGYCIKDRKVH